MKKDEFYTKLGIFSDSLSHEQISSILGIKCDKGYNKGDRRGNTIIYEKENGWIIFSQISRDLPLIEHVKNVLERISPVIEKVKALEEKPGIEVELGCVIHAKKEPPIFFTKDVILALSKIGASIDIDLYFWQRNM